MTLMADVERIEHGRSPVEMDTVKRLYDRLRLAVQKMLVALGDLGDPRSEDLLKGLQQFARQTTPLFDPVLSIPAHPVLLPLSEIRAEMAALVGHKAANLAVIGHSVELPVPEGFVLTARAFDLFMAENDLFDLIEAYLHGIDVERTGPIEERSEQIRRLILQAPVPGEIEKTVAAEMARWAHRRGGPVFTAVRSTGIGEDTEISFAGQFATLLNIPPSAILTAYKEVIASKYSAGAILYRMRYGLDDRATPMAVMVMEMISAMASGVVYTRHPSKPDQDDLQISAIHGLGEYLMSGDIAPHVCRVERRRGGIQTTHTPRQTHWMTSNPAGGTCLTSMPDDKASEPPVDADGARHLAAWGTRLEKYFGAPQDVEWALDPQARFFVLQSRPLGLDGAPVVGSDDLLPLEKHPILHHGGRTACSGMVSGRLHHTGPTLSEAVAADSILVIPKAAPEYTPLIGRVRGVIAARGSAASHLASVAREFGVPMIVDCGPLDDRWKQGLWVTLHADTATVYRGQIDQRTVPSASQAFTRLMETPIRRRLRALSNRIVPRKRRTGGTKPSPDVPSSLHDLICQAFAYAMESLHARRTLVEASPRVIRWTAENAAGDFGLEAVDKASPHGLMEASFRTGWGEKLLHALWIGMGAWDTRRGRAALLETDGWALLDKDVLRIMVPLQGQQLTLEILRSTESAAVDLRARIAGGDGPFYNRCLRTVCLAGILDELGVAVRINGAQLDARTTIEEMAQMEALVGQIGRLLTFTRMTAHQLVGPWIVRHLQASFQTGTPPENPSAPDLPRSVVPLAGYWRQATLDGHGVILHDGAAVDDWRLSPLTKGTCHQGRDHRVFFDQLHRDHFMALMMAEDSRMGDGQIDLVVNLVGGRHACAGGVVFGYGDAGRYFVMGLDAQRKRLVLYETIHGRRFKRLRKRYPIHTDRWYDIALRISALSIQVHVDGIPLMAYTADSPVAGRVGLWAWDDTVALFDGFSLMAGTRRTFAE